MKIPDITTVKTADQATDLAIEWSNTRGNRDWSFQELADWQAFFRELARKFPELRDEFEENAII